MSAKPAVQEGKIPFEGHSTGYRIVGDLTAGTPLLVLHGGPGVPHDYLRPLERLATPDRAVVFYDQSGCGRSTRPNPSASWTLDHFLSELTNLRGALGLKHIHLYGHSWGGILALEHALVSLGGIQSLVLSDTTASLPLHAQEVAKLRKVLPVVVQQQLEHHERADSTHDPGYEEASMAFYARHICRLDPWPEALVNTFGAMNPRIYGEMWGSEVRITGNLRDWDVRERLHSVNAPTLVLGGRQDAMTPTEQAVLHSGIKGSELVLFQNSSHLPMYEEPDAYFTVLERFLAGKMPPARTPTLG